MMETLIIFIILSVIVIVILFALWKSMIDLNNHITELERQIDNLQYQTDDVLCDINILNQNVLKAYGLLSNMKDENEND